MIKIWGRTDSSNVQKVLWCLGELGLPFERQDWGGKFGGNKDNDYLAMNPNGLVPTIQDGDFILWESNAILRYLAHKSGRFRPAGPNVGSIADQWMDWQQTTYNIHVSPIFINMIRTPPEKRDIPLVERSRKDVTEQAQILDAHLDKNDYVAGKEFSIGDIPVAITTYRFLALVSDRPPLPHLQRWYDAVSARPAFKEHIPPLT